MATTDSTTEPPTFRPDRYNAPAYDEIRTHADLIAYSKAYFCQVVAHYDMDVDAAHVIEWEISTRAKRRAAAVKSLPLAKLANVRLSPGVTKPDWDAIREACNDDIRQRNGNMADFTDAKDVKVSLTWGAFEAFDEAEWQDTIRHEAVHVEEHHTYGKSTHGPTFERRAAELGAAVHCPQFEDYKYAFDCTACGEAAGGRYRDGKVVRSARASDGYATSGCCDAPITLRE